MDRRQFRSVTVLHNLCVKNSVNSHKVGTLNIERAARRMQSRMEWLNRQ